jgi:AcrR family transcriptional regulator
MKMNARSPAAAPKTRGRAAAALRSRRREAVAEVFVDAAEEVIGAKGFERATMQDVARAAGCAAGTLYLYFKSKEDLFSAMVSKHVNVLSASHRRAFAEAPDAVSALRTTLTTFLAYFNQHRTFFRIFYTAGPGGRAHIPSNLRGDALEGYLATKRGAIASFRRSSKKGLVRADVPPEELVEFVDAVLVVTLARWSTTGEPPPPAKQFDLLWRLLSGGLGFAESVR